MKALVVNALGGGFDLDDVQIAAPRLEATRRATDLIDSTKAKPVDAVHDRRPG
jgi:hypothetical protein